MNYKEIVVSFSILIEKR